MGGKEAPDAFGEMTAGKRRAGDVADVVIEYKPGPMPFAYKLRSPRIAAHFAPVIFPVIHDLYLPDRTVRIQAERVGDELVFADDFVHKEPAPSVDLPGAHFGLAHGDAAAFSIALR